MRFLAIILALILCSTVQAEQYTFKGTWYATNRPINGEMTCIFTGMGRDKNGVQHWRGRFYGVWQGVDFDYTVDFTGEPDNLTGTAVVDASRYRWHGKANQGSFNATYTGDKYNGGFNLKNVSPPPKQTKRKDKTREF